MLIKILLTFAVLGVLTWIEPKDLAPNISLLGFVSCVLAVGVGILVACLSGHWILGVFVGIVGLLGSIIADDSL